MQSGLYFMGLIRCRLALFLLLSLLSSCVMKQPPGAGKADPALASQNTLNGGATPNLLNGKITSVASSDNLVPGVAPTGITAERAVDAATPLPETPKVTLTGWKRSAAEAIREARVQNKPLLIAITNQQIETSQQFESTLLASKEFREAAGDAFVLLIVDYGDKETAQSDYYRDFKARLNLRGYPVLLIMLPDAHEIVRLKGYVPEWKNRFIQSIQEAKPHVEQAVALRRKQMEATGYRLWSSTRSAKVFAKLESIDANQATFKGEWGEEFRTFITRLSEEDQKWISAHAR